MTKLKIYSDIYKGGKKKKIVLFFIIRLHFYFMGLFSWFWKLLKWFGFGNKENKIVIIGLDNSGKTSLLHMLKEGQFIQFDQTVSYHIEKFEFEGVQISAFDLGGHESVRSLWKEYIFDATAIIFVVDSADRNRINEAKLELHSILNDSQFSNVPILIFGNKIDKAGSLSFPLLREQLELEEFIGIDTKELCPNNKCIKIVMCSVLQNFNLKLGLKWLIKKI